MQNLIIYTFGIIFKYGQFYKNRPKKARHFDNNSGGEYCFLVPKIVFWYQKLFYKCLGKIKGLLLCRVPQNCRAISDQ